MLAFFDAYHKLFVTNTFIFYNDKYYFHENYQLIDAPQKVNPDINKFVYTFMSKLLNGYYVVGLESNGSIGKRLCTLRDKPMNPIISSGMLRLDKDLSISRCDYRVLRNHEYDAIRFMKIILDKHIESTRIVDFASFVNHSTDPLSSVDMYQPLRSLFVEFFDSKKSKQDTPYFDKEKAKQVTDTGIEVLRKMMNAQNNTPMTLEETERWKNRLKTMDENIQIICSGNNAI